MPPKRKAAAVFEEEDEAQASQAQASQAPAAISAQTADTLANKLCRYVLLREHTRKPVTRSDMRAAVMSEHNDRAGKIFRQVLAAANEKLYALAGLELVAVSEAVEEEGGDAATQGGVSQSQVGASQAAVVGKAMKAGSYLLVNRLKEPARTDLADAPQAYLAFVEVVLSCIQQSGDIIDEERLFGYLEQIGLSRKECLPAPADQEKVESLVQKRLVSEAWLARKKKPNDPDNHVYVAGARALLSRNVERADAMRTSLLQDKQ